MRHWFALAFVLTSAVRMPSRASRKLGESIVFFSPSTMSCMASFSPVAAPYLATSATRMSHSVAAQISPSLWTSQTFELPTSQRSE